MTWRERRVQDMARLTNGYPFDSADFSSNGEVPLVRIRDLLTTSFETFVPSSSVPKEVVIQNGDIVIGMDGDFNVVYWDRGPAALNQRLCLLSALPDCDGRFLAYALPDHLQIINDLTYSTTVKHLSSSQVKGIRLHAPAGSLQRSIADYLDWETAKIDILIEEQQQLIEMLIERRDAVWSAEFKRLVGSSPEVPVRRLIESIVDGPFGSSLTSTHYVDEGTRVIRLGNIGINEFKGDDSAYIPTDYAAQLSAHSVRAGDVVVAGLGDEKMPLGRAAVVPEIGPAIVKADCYRVRPSSAVTAAYLAWALSAPPTRSQMALLARGATRARLNTSVVQEVTIPIPPIDIQREVVDRTTEQLKKTDLLIDETERFIELSRERRAALITAAVTGQIDVREKVGTGVA